MLFKRICFFFLSIGLLISYTSKSQTPFNLGPPVNSLITSEYAPSLVGNGRTMIFQATTGEDNKPEVVISHAKSSIWSRPEPVPNFASVTGKIAIPTDANISYDGNYIFYSAGKYGGVGGIDIWYIEKTGNGFGPPQNLAKPINSAGNEADPSLSSDGKYLYFVRHTGNKSTTGEPCGKIYVSEKTGNLWKEPKALPSPINMGCECSPRILADNQTLIFASTRSGGKGGFDQYRTQLKENGTWSAPVAIAFINSSKDDRYAAIPAQGNFIYHTGPSKGEGTDIYKTILPKELRPKNVISIDGVVQDKQTKKPLSARVIVYDTKKNSIAHISQTDASGRYLVYLTEGTQYDFSVSANNKSYTFYSEFIDLNTLADFEERRTDIDLTALKKDITITLGNIAFENLSVKIPGRSNFEIGRVQRLLQESPTAVLEIGVNTDEVITDSIPSPLLPEVIIDSIQVEVEEESIVMVIDSLGASVPSDSTEIKIKTITVAKKTYHNDITQKQADAIVNELVKKGIPKARLIGKGYGDKNPIQSNNDKALNRRIEIKVIKP